MVEGPGDVEDDRRVHAGRVQQEPLLRRADRRAQGCVEQRHQVTTQETDGRVLQVGCASLAVGVVTCICMSSLGGCCSFKWMQSEFTNIR